MTKRFITFGSIGQFRQVLKTVTEVAKFVRLDENNNPIYNHSATMPIITGTVTEKIHGSNAAVCYSEPDGMWFQSRKNIITSEQDNAGCAFFAATKMDVWLEIINTLACDYNINLCENIISVYYEWCGGNIQKSSAVSGLDKRAIIFQHFKVSPIEHSEDEVSCWHATNHASFNEHDIYNIMNFPNYLVVIDFDRPSIAQNKLIKMVEEDIEPNSPVGKQFGVDGNVGEGVVITFEYKGSIQRFKVKGEKHSKSRVKTLKPVNIIKEQKKIDFVNTVACTPSRLEQAWQVVFGIDNELNEPDIKFTGDFLRAVIKDVMKEEMDLIAETGCEPKELNPMISKSARIWFMEQLDSGA